VARRPGRTALALLVPLLLFVVYGMVRVAAPVSALGLLFDEPVGFAVVAAAASLAGAALLFLRPLEVAVAGVIGGPARDPSDAERQRLDRLLTRVGARARMKPKRLIVRVQEQHGANAAAGAGHLLFVTTGALALPDDQLEAVLAHELGHHRGMHPVLGAVVWWLRLPGVALAAAYRLLQRAVQAATARLGALGRLVAAVLLLLLLVWQVLVMWIFYLGELLAMWAARVSEYEADAAAARWGYAEPLASAYAALGAHEVEPAGRFRRLAADHPPLSARIAVLRGAKAPAVGAHP
jgi:Zn-dependent protease with chaperone function